MSPRDRDDGPPPDEAPLDLSAWTAPTPPRGLTGRVIAAVRAGAVAAPDVALDAPAPAPAPVDGARRWRGVLGGLVVGVSAAGALWMLWPRPPRATPSAGHVLAAAPSKLALGPGTVALLRAGAELTWRRDGTTLVVAHAAGAVTFQHAGPDALHITIPGATVHTARATLLVEVPVNKPLVAGVAGAGLAAAIIVAVFDGRAEVREPTGAVRVVESGSQLAVAAPAPARPTFQPVARAVKDRAQRDALAAAIAAVRAQAAAGASAARVAAPGGGALPPGGAAPSPGPTAAIDPTPGELSKDEIRAGVREVIPMLADCYDAMIERQPSLHGQVVAHLTVDSEPDLGTIVTMHDDSEIAMRGAPPDVDPRALAADLGELRTCLGATLESIALPPLGAKDGGHVEIHYPFVFSQRDDDAVHPTPDEERATDEKPAERAAPRRAAVPLKPIPNTATFDDLLAAAETAAKQAEWDRALALVDGALARHPAAAADRVGRAHLIGALAACNLRRTTSARAHARGATPAVGDLIRQRCRAVGIDLGPDAPAPTDIDE